MKKGLLIALLSIGAIGVGGGVTYACVSAGKQAQEPETSETAESQEGEEEQSEEDVKHELEEWAKEKWDTYVAPIVGGVSITAVLSFVATFVVAYMKEKKFKLNMDELKSLYAKTIDLVLTVSKINEAVERSDKTADETKEYVTKVCGEIVETVSTVSRQVGDIDKIKPILMLLVQLETKMAECSDIALQSGIADDIREIKTLISNF